MKKLILSFILFFSVIINAQNFKVDFDYARFFYNDTSNYFEVYYSFYQSQLKQVQTGDQLTVTGLLNVKVSDKDNSNILVNKNYQFHNIVEDSLSGSQQKSFTGNLGFVIPVGEYKCVLTGMDGNDLTKVDSISFPLKISDLPPDRFYISDLEVSSLIRQSEQKNSMFYKNTYEVVPNPSGIFGHEVPVLYFYSEIYNINKGVKSEYLKLDHLLLNTDNKTVYKKSKLISRATASAVDVEAMNISKLPSGTYTLVDAATDSAKNLTVYSTKKIFIYNPSVVDTTPVVSVDNSALTSEFASMSEEELNQIFNESKYLATSQEKDQWEALEGEKAKQNFLFKFWKARDLTPETPENEFKRDYFERVKKANSLYTNIQRKGWKTDRGRVLLLYGEPSEIERFPNQSGTKPYEIWHYNDLEGGVNFVFADLTGFSDYTLVNSTKRGEISDPNWQRKIYSK
jgi:GWxTD domain-containing protein